MKKFGTKVCITDMPHYQTWQSFVSSDGSEMCTVRIVAMFEWSKSVICEIKR